MLSAMRARFRGPLGLILLLGAPYQGAAQVQDSLLSIRGRVEDAATRGAIAGARVFTEDSASVAVTDSLGNFDLPVAAPGPWVVLTDRFGYLSQRFELAGGPVSHGT